MLIGVTGSYGAGKDTMAEYLVKKSFYHISLSDILREELRKQKKEVTRDNLINLGNELREKFGHSVLAEMALKKMEADKNYVISSIRNPSEVDALKKRKDFILVSVTAPVKVRYERLLARKKKGEDFDDFETFSKKEKEEESSDPAKQQVHKVVKMARVVIQNTDGIDGFNTRINQFLQEWMPKLRLQRPSWDEYFMRIGKVVASRSNCMKRHVAAVIVKDKRIISTGYNGTPRGVRNCNEGGCKRCNSFATGGTQLDECTCSHGEENAIVQASYHGVSLKDSTIYTTFSPCLTCAKMIINAGIKEVVFNVDYPLAETAAGLLKEAGVKVRQFKIDK